MDVKTDKNVITAFILGVLVTAIFLGSMWLSHGISKEEAADIVIEKIYSDFGNDNYVVEVISVEDFGKDLYKVDISIKKVAAAENVSHLVTKDGNIIREIEKTEESTEQKTGEEQSVPSQPIEKIHYKGPADAKVTIVEYSDFQCSFCKRFYDGAYKRILEAYPNDVKFVFKDFPLSFHQMAYPAAEAAECAGAQGKYWEYHDKLFENQQEWSASGRAALEKYAEELGLDMDSFKNCIETREFKDDVAADFREGQAKGVRGTPAFFINGKMLTGAQPFSTFKSEIDAALAAAG